MELVIRIIDPISGQLVVEFEAPTNYADNLTDAKLMDELMQRRITSALRQRDLGTYR